MLNDYPRPQLKRDSYICLNGKWEYAIKDNKDIPASFDGEILVPFTPETKISGVNRIVQPNEWLFYRKTIKLDESFIKDKVLLHFDGVDQIMELYINDQFVGSHIGGYIPFVFDIKPYLSDNKFTIVVKVKDMTENSFYSRGKQTLNRGGIWYTPQSGIWMPVWLESVNNGYIESIKLTPNIDEDYIEITVKSISEKAIVTLLDKGYEINCNKPTKIKMTNYQLWNIDNPYLYDIKIKTNSDEICSYFAMRKVSNIIDENGHHRMAINNKPIFIKGTLDQGYFIEGYLTPSSISDYVKDIQMLKDMGFNTIRKHIKIESPLFYYLCDKMGMLVFQDFVSGGGTYNKLHITSAMVTKHYHKDIDYRYFNRKDEEGRQFAKQEMIDTISYLYNYPSIVLWTIFNEGWGQFNSEDIYNELIKLDNTRLYDHASGWHDQGISDIKSIHTYFFKIKMPRKKTIKDRITMITECGGYHLVIKDHIFSEKTFGYKKMGDVETLIKSYNNLVNVQIKPLISKGLSGFIYTQTSDVEDELNGLVTYDRKVIKVEPKIIKEINDKCDY